MCAEFWVAQIVLDRVWTIHVPVWLVGAGFYTLLQDRRFYIQIPADAVVSVLNVEGLQIVKCNERSPALIASSCFQNTDGVSVVNGVVPMLRF